jgi:TatD DNase family protein
MPHESPIESPPQQQEATLQEATQQSTSQKTTPQQTTQQETSQEDAPLELVDSHAHLDVSDFDSDREAMLARAQAAGVETILAIGGGGADPAALGSSLPFAEQHSWIYAAAGIHPHEARLATQAHYDTLSRIAAHPRFLGWGEIGLDYHYDHSPRDVQQRVFTD